MANKNSNLGAAKAAKNDEFYTQYEDIEREMNAYLEYDENVFRDKTILLPCDDPEWSNFTRYFAQNFERFGLKKLISTSYAVESKKIKEWEPTLFETESPLYDADKSRTNGKIFVLDADINGNNRIDIEDLKWGYLEGDGDFRSDEVKRLRDEADIIISNPPFSIFKEYLAWLIESKKQFIYIANKNSVTYKEVFPLIKQNRLWAGRTEWSGGMWFLVPNESTDYDRIVDGRKMKNVSSAWFANIEHGRRHEPLRLMSMSDNVKYSRHKDIRGSGYCHYENYDAIEVPYTDAIPLDYDGIMGVPISFLEKYCPEQFEILGMCENEDLYGLRTRKFSSEECREAYMAKFGKKGTYDLNASGVITIDGRKEKVYQRILIRKKQ